ncbi:MAG: Ca2+-binding EF-hand superfamily protein [Pseudohongiellaceae bacterium]|jgi:Ca2+-binding EF-hand superfamily protein
MNRVKFAITLGLVSVSSALVAQDHKGPLEALDNDGNGSISFAEFQQNGSNMLARIDTDDNGVLTIDEFLNAPTGRGPGHGNRGENSDQANEEQRADRRANMTERAAAAFQEMDIDGDEVVSVAEFQQANFLRMDRDGNGVLTAEELRPPRGQRGKGHRGDRTPPA